MLRRFIYFLRWFLPKGPQSEFPDIADEFVPIFHFIRQIWNENSYYAKPERLIVLIRKLCNVIIDRAVEYIGENVFNKIIDDPDKEIQQLESTRQIIKKFMDAYAEYKDKDGKNWEITRNVIFFRLDAFNDRIGDILNISKSYSEFSKMRTKVIGGIKGEALGQTLIDIFNECTKEIKNFISEEYHPLEINDTEFNNKYVNFKDALKELEIPKEFHLPMDPRLIVEGFIIEKCKVMNSKKKPFWLVFKNAALFSTEPVITMFKAGDDLRQDQLTLQFFFCFFPLLG